MCYPTTCNTCRKTTWGGCGQHADTVMRSVPAADRCNCTRTDTAPKTGFLRSLFGR
ncbi:MAG: hypothetical protein GXY65_12190 [Rhodococcus sp.]|uniref:hypothetical protein n=1 Tax=Rhodococcus TaxID=1827 RepID=UPI0016ACEFB9|nr:MULTISPECIES: hypothetical protein [Rhodococcus]NLV80077.1 hypothetical protein [Rhodococcus sp. (in: high G+C Gram-positive bacteria)]